MFSPCQEIDSLIQFLHTGLMQKLPLWQYSLITGSVFWVIFIGLSFFISSIYTPKTSFFLPDFTPIYYAFIIAVITTTGFSFYTAKSKLISLLSTVGSIILIALCLIVFIYIKRSN